jgi:hypothetical protein
MQLLQSWLLAGGGTNAFGGGNASRDCIWTMEGGMVG